MATALASGSVIEGAEVRVEIPWSALTQMPNRALLVIGQTLYRVVDRSVAPHDGRGYLWLQRAVAD